VRLAIVASDAPAAQQAAAALAQRYAQVAVDAAECIVALGGDGFMLRTLHRYLALGIPVYGMKLGRVGFLMNQHHADDLEGRIGRAHTATLHPLEMRVTTAVGEEHTALAFIEVSLLRQSNQAAHIEVSLNGATKLENLICDGILVSTPAGSTAYNLSAHGPILPLDANVLALTPNSPFRPRRWRGAILNNHAVVTFRTREADKRPASAVADSTEFQKVVEVTVREDRGQKATLLFDPGTGLEERVLTEQFRY
jgi:NAD+ kinase